MRRLFFHLLLLFLSFPFYLSAQDLKDNTVEEAILSFQYKTAIGLLDEMPQTYENRLLKAQCYEKIFDFGSALAIYKSLLIENPDDLQTVISTAECAAQTGDSDKSLEYWIKADELSPDNLYLKTKKMLAYYNNENWKGTIAASEEVFEIDSIPQLLRMTGNAYMKLGDIGGISYFLAALRKNPSDYQSLSQIANFYYSAKLYDNAIAVTDSFLTNINPNHKSIAQTNGMANYSAGNYQKAIDRLKRNTEIGDSSYTTYYTLGMSYYATKRFRDASDWLGYAHKMDSIDLNLLYFYGNALMQSNQNREGIKILLQGLAKIDETKKLQYNFDSSLANAHLSLKEYNKAIDYLKSCYRQKPKENILLYSIGYAYDLAKQPKNAIDYYERFLKTKPKELVVDDSPVDAGKLESLPMEVAYYKAAFGRIKELKAGEKDKR